MKIVFFMIFIPLISFAAETDTLCLGVNDYPAVTAHNYMTDVLGIDAMDIDENKIRVRLVDRQTITPLMGKVIVEEKIKEPHLGSDIDERIVLNDIYVESKINIVTVKVQFENFSEAKNSFIVSSYTNDAQCSIGQAGLILLNRGF